MTHELTTLAPGILFGDLHFLGRRRVIATALLLGSDGVAIVDPGPTSVLPTLRAHLAAAGADLSSVSALLLTHIHLDHAGAAGVIVRENPAVKVWVHEVGAPHMVDPSKLMASAGRLYGDDMERLWGEVVPVPESAIESLRGGEQITAGGRQWEVAHTPGHASHHVSYFSGDARLAFVGDTAGVQVVPGGFIVPPTPPPDIDMPRWKASLDLIERWHPETLFLTHFGPAQGASAHMAELRDHLDLFERIGNEALSKDLDEAGREAWFISQIRLKMGQRLSESDMRAYELAGRSDLNWRGLARYLTRRRP